MTEVTSPETDVAALRRLAVELSTEHTKLADDIERRNAQRSIDMAAALARQATAYAAEEQAWGFWQAVLPVALQYASVETTVAQAERLRKKYVAARDEMRAAEQAATALGLAQMHDMKVEYTALRELGERFFHAQDKVFEVEAGARPW